MLNENRKIKLLEGDELMEELYHELDRAIQLLEERGIDNWYLHDGSLLGCMRYGKIIPWDDDIDIAIKRSDYEAFHAHLEINNLLFEDKTAVHTKLISENLVDEHGYPISVVDIFPLDYVELDRWDVLSNRLANEMCLRHSHILDLTEDGKGLDYLKTKHPELLLRYPNSTLIECNMTIEALAYNEEPAAGIGNFINSRNIFKELKDASDYDGFETNTLGGITVRVPHNPVKVLEARYGKGCITNIEKFESHQKIYKLL